LLAVFPAGSEVVADGIAEGQTRARPEEFAAATPEPTDRDGARDDASEDEVVH
jgi:hypothetical protein